MPARHWFLVLLLALVGCSRNSELTLEGEVRYLGKPVAEGYITLVPVDSRGATRGAPIIAGRYEVTHLQPGRWRVLISTRPQLLAVATSASRNKLVRATKSPNHVPGDARGNNQVIALASDTTIWDFRLER